MDNKPPEIQNEGPYFCDNEIPEDRVLKLHFVFKDIEESTQGVFTQKDIASSRKVLDLGMGRGCAGAAIKELCPNCQLTGVDTTEYQGANCYPLYNQRFCGDDGDLTKEEVWNKLAGTVFDLIISVGLPSQVTDYLIKNIKRLEELMSQKGVLILISDIPYTYYYGGYHPLTLFKGSLGIDKSILIYRKPSPDIIPLSQMEDILKTEHGVIFFPKRDFHPPEIADKNLTRLVSDTNLEDAQRIISILSRFLNKDQAAGDKWGKNHDGRVEWRRTMRSKYGPTFTDIYYKNNQFRINKLGLVRVVMSNLCEYLEERDHIGLADRLKKIYQEMSNRLIDYHKLESLDDKLEVVQFFEDKVLEVLELLLAQ